MSSPVAQAELMRSLGRLVRGLSALFWGLPLALVVSVQTAETNLFLPFREAPPVIANALLYYGLHQLAFFQPQERIWRNALDRARLLALVTLGLSPFLYWWKMMPHELYFRLAVALLALAGLLFLFNLNFVLQRLAAMLPDETIRLETRMFTNLNLYMLVAIVLLVASWAGLNALRPLPPSLVPVLYVLARTGPMVLLLLVLMPLAMTMAMLWKMKETILASLLAASSGPSQPG